MYSFWDFATLVLEAFQDKSCLFAAYLLCKAEYYFYLELMVVDIIRLKQDGWLRTYGFET